MDNGSPPMRVDIGDAGAAPLLRSEAHGEHSLQKDQLQARIIKTKRHLPCRSCST